MLEETYGRHPLGYSQDPFTCGLSGKSYSALEVKDRVSLLRRSLAQEFAWKPNEGSEFDRVIGIYCLNSVCSQAGCLHLASMVVDPDAQSVGKFNV